MRLNNMNMADIMAFIDDDCYELEEKAEKIFNYITDLEAKLAEKDTEHELLINQFEEETEKLRKQIKQESDARKRFVEEVKKLKQELAEKELEAIRWEEHFNNAKMDYECLQEQLTEKEKEIEINKNALKKLIKNCGTVKCENKISFAVERLEEVKKFCDKVWGVDKAEEVIEEFVDNQIKQLKEGE